MTGATCGAGNAYPSGAPDFTSGFYRGSCCVLSTFVFPKFSLFLSVPLSHELVLMSLTYTCGIFVVYLANLKPI